VTDRAAVVLAGGFATRFGDGDKTVATLSGKPLLVHACEPLVAVGAEVVVSCRDAQVDTFEGILDGAGLRGVQLCPDETPDQGPLAGLGDALGVVEAETVAVATADMPCVPAGLWGDCFDALGGEDRDAAAVSEDNRHEPVPSAFRTAAVRGTVDTALAAGEARLAAAFEGLSVETVPATAIREEWGETALADVNTRAALERLRSRGGCLGSP